MSMNADLDHPYPHLPHPEYDRQFYAGVPGKRLIAWLVDTIAVVAIILVVAIMTFGLGFFLLAPLSFAVAFLYRWMTLAGRSATPGMRLMGIELRTANGERFDTAAAFLHTLGFMVASSFVLPQIISVGMMSGTSYGRGLHDLLLGSVAINRPE